MCPFRFSLLKILLVIQYVNLDGSFAQSFSEHLMTAYKQ